MVGQRAHTRHLLSRPFRRKGCLPLSIYLRPYHMGDYVDIKVNGAVHKGMPHKFYHGCTGKVWNVTKRAIGVQMRKQVGNRTMNKRIHVRVEHVVPSRCHEDFLRRVKLNTERRLNGKKRFKREPVGPMPSFVVVGVSSPFEYLTPIPYDVVNDLKGGY